MGLLKHVFKLISFLASFIGTIAIIIITFFFLDQKLSYVIAMGLILVEIISFFSRISREKVNKLLFYAKQRGMNRTKRSKFKKIIQDKKNISRYIARATLLTFILSKFQAYLIMPTIIFSVFIILFEMNSKKLSLLKVIKSIVVGAIASLIAVFIPNLIF